MSRIAPPLTYGGVPVPFTVSWSAENDRFWVGDCPHARRRAILQTEAQGIGKPAFGKPHSQRQRQAIADGLCDTCGKPLKLATKVSLSHARIRLDGARGPCVMQVEPLLHRGCARLSLQHCPSLKRDVRDGTLMVRQVGAYEVQFAVMDRAYTLEIAGEATEAVGHAKVVLRSWRDRDAGWLEAA